MYDESVSQGQEIKAAYLISWDAMFLASGGFTSESGKTSYLRKLVWVYCQSRALRRESCIASLTNASHWYIEDGQAGFTARNKWQLNMNLHASGCGSGKSSMELVAITASKDNKFHTLWVLPGETECFWSFLGGHWQLFFIVNDNLWNINIVLLIKM